MALLGAQLVITLIMVSVIQKLGSHFSLGKWILCSTGLKRFLYPTDQELRALVGYPKDKHKKNKNHANGHSSETFQIPRNLDVTLETVPVTASDIVYLKFYTDFQWMFDFAIYGVLVYAMTEIYNKFYPIKDEINLSMVWCCLVLVFAFKVLILLWVQYFKGEESIGERSTCIVTGFVYLLISMMILIVDENTLELGLDNAYSSFNHTASIFLSKQNFSSSGPASKLIVKFSFAVFCGFVGSLFTFPGLRVSRMHWDTLKYYKDNKFILLLTNISYVSPLILTCLWIKPISRDYLTERIFSGMTEPIMTPTTFESMRLIVIIIAILLKIVLMPIYLQSYLNLANQRLEMQKKEAGKISNKEFQKKIAAVFYYLCVVALQYITPLIILLYCTLMYKTLGGYSWEGIYKSVDFEECPAPQPLEDIKSSIVDGEIEADVAQDIAAALFSVKQIFTAEIFRGIFGLATWWTLFTLFATTALGMVYQSYFTNV
ncbi:transmembrane protein 161B [Trichogramma pretiosum]|uniref:transmembrane protein 161B n=1 Tax=Trichogramma pretiosum TaxID=7493 RepID=UPI0006C99DE4|nr:transmembrane protein 161B [Trichogramma pretiosum]XP_023313593.1 transmembrane protein 161B [Trichogramma pretiosum]